MKVLSQRAKQKVLVYFEAAAEVSEKATCLRAHCGTVIVKGGKVIGEGYNSPPLDNESSRTCELELIKSPKPKYDRTCCVHAEWRAILNAAKSHPEKINGSSLYFMRTNNGEMTKAGNPYCTVCSRLAMESGIKEFVLWHEQGITVYPVAEYDRLSYEFHKQVMNKNTSLEQG